MKKEATLQTKALALLARALGDPAEHLAVATDGVLPDNLAYNAANEALGHKIGGLWEQLNAAIGELPEGEAKAKMAKLAYELEEASIELRWKLNHELFNILFRLFVAPHIATPRGK
jgi:hypothetical protein